MNRRRTVMNPRLSPILMVAACLLSAAEVAPQASDREHAPDAQVRAVYLYNFAKFVRWPASALPPEGGPIRIGVFDTAPLRDAFKLLEGRKAQGRVVEFVPCETVEAMHACQIVYLNSDDGLFVKSVLARLAGSPVLTVGDGPSFSRWGGMLGLDRRYDRIHLMARPDVALAVGVKLSSRLLGVAEIYKSPADRSGDERKDKDDAE